MHMLSSSHYDVLNFGLKKVAEDWNAKPGDGFLYFIFSPPWAKKPRRRFTPPRN